MSLLSVIRDVCATVGIVMPTSVFAGINADRTLQELVALANEMAQRTAYDTREWQVLKRLQTYTGDGVTTAWPLPADYKRMLLTTGVFRSTTQQHAMQFVGDTNDWARRRASTETSSWGEWTLLGGQMLIQPALELNTSAWFTYLSKNCITLASGGYGDTFQADGDSYLLDERLLKLNMIWQWLANKGQPYAEQMGTYSDALQIAMGSDQPAPILADRGGVMAYSNLSLLGGSPHW